jgi:CheY-like chemotaxis protein
LRELFPDPCSSVLRFASTITAGTSNVRWICRTERGCRSTARRVGRALRADPSVTSQAVQKAQAATVLWVDDNPDNNIYVRRSDEALGVRFVTATSTDDGLAQAQRQTFDAIILDMGRGIDRTAGYKLLEVLRKAGIQSRYVIYAASTDPKRTAEAKRRGALDATNRPDELFQLVLSAIGSRG